MLQVSTKKIMLTGLMAMLCLLSIGGVTARAGSSPSQTLKQSADAMSKLQSFHAKFTSTENVHSSGNGSMYTVDGTADAAQGTQMQVALSNGSQPLANMVSTGQHVYAQRGTGPWYMTKSSNLSGDLQKYISQGLPASMGQLLSALQSARLVDRGQETINGTKVDHITATLGPQSLQAVTSQLNGMLPSQWQSNQNQLQRGVVDLWIDPATSYLHQMKIDAHAQADQMILSQGTGLPTDSTASVPVDIKSQLNATQFNQSISIKVPSNATPYPAS